MNCSSLEGIHSVTQQIRSINGVQTTTASMTSQECIYRGNSKTILT